MSVLSVVHCKIDPYDIYIGRPSKWGNPFYMKEGVSRQSVLDHYKLWILGNRSLLLDLHELDGKILGCWCAPRLCHGHVLAELVDILYQGGIPHRNHWTDDQMNQLDGMSFRRPDPWTICEEPYVEERYISRNYPHTVEPRFG